MTWEKWERAAESGPEALAKRAGCFLLVVIVVAVPTLGVLGYVGGWFSEAASVMRDEFGPRELLRKYEWFKDAAAQADAKMATLAMYDKRQQSMIDSYTGPDGAFIPRHRWPREDREQFNLWESEKAGVAASYNALAAEYNAQMAKFNWRFCEAGTLPKGATQPLPREFKPYLEK